MKSTGRGEGEPQFICGLRASGAWSRRAFLKKPLHGFFSID
jgi:hypothetical protein